LPVEGIDLLVSGIAQQQWRATRANPNHSPKAPGKRRMPVTGATFSILPSAIGLHAI